MNKIIQLLSWRNLEYSFSWEKWRFYTTVLIAFWTKLKQIIKIKINKYTNHKYENFNVSVSAKFYILIDIWLYLISTMDTIFKQKLPRAEDPQRQNKILQLKNWKLSIKISLRQSSLAKPFKKVRSESFWQ